jgi:aminoglycoside 2'-N-acetyltransferase I
MAEVERLCDTAYATDTSRFFESLGPGDHLLGRSNETIVSHLMWITRWLQPEGGSPLRTAYIEMVATAPDAQRKGYASALLAHFPSLVEDFELAALCPATEDLYIRLGWRFWRGPLSARKADKIVETPGERVMILRLPNTPPLDLNGRLSVEWRGGEVW